MSLVKGVVASGTYILSEHGNRIDIRHVSVHISIVIEQGRLNQR
jgi:hypothetical protein